MAYKQNPIVKAADLHVGTLKIERAIQGVKRSNFPNDGIIAFAIACNILACLLGKGWVEKRVFNSNKSLNEFLADINDPKNDADLHRRVVMLAEMLFNFQNTEGIENQLVKLNLSEIEATFNELRVAKLLRMYRYDPKFVKESGVKGEDFDIRCSHSILGPLSVEVKSKLASTKISERTIKDSLSSANKQLPENGRGVIMISLPEAWTGLSVNNKANECFINVAAGFLENHPNLQSVVALNEYSSEEEEAISIRNIAIEVKRNGDEVVPIFDESPTQLTESLSWFRIRDMVPLVK